MTERWYVTRSSRQARTDEDRAMAHDQLGPFEDYAQARVALINHICAHVEPNTPIGRMFVHQYVRLLAALALDPAVEEIGYEGVVWTFRSVPAPASKSDTCGQSWVAEIELCPRCGQGALAHDTNGDNDEPRGRVVTLPVAAPPRSDAVVTSASDLTPAMRAGLLNWNTARRATRDALIRRGLVYDHSGGVTDAGVRVRDALSAELPTGEAQAATVAEDGDPGAIYVALRTAAPVLTDVARYVAQLMRWSREDDPDEWSRGRRDAFAMVAEQLERQVLGDLAGALMPEAVRLDDASVSRKG